MQSSQFQNHPWEKDFESALKIRSDMLKKATLDNKGSEHTGKTTWRPRLSPQYIYLLFPLCCPSHSMFFVGTTSMLFSGPTGQRHQKTVMGHKKQLLYVWTLVYKLHTECFLGYVEHKTEWSQGLPASLAVLRIKLDTRVCSYLHL